MIPMARLALNVDDVLQQELEQIALDRNVTLAELAIGVLEDFTAEVLNKPTTQIVARNADGSVLHVHNSWAPERIAERQKKQDQAILAGRGMIITGNVPQGA